MITSNLLLKRNPQKSKIQNLGKLNFQNMMKLCLESIASRVKKLHGQLLESLNQVRCGEKKLLFFPLLTIFLNFAQFQVYFF